MKVVFKILTHNVCSSIIRVRRETTTFGFNEANITMEIIIS